MQRRYPARHYVIVDDKPRLLAAIKRALGERVTTVFVRQGHYAAEAAGSLIEPPPDIAVDRIGDLADASRRTRLLSTPAVRKPGVRRCKGAT